MSINCSVLFRLKMAVGKITLANFTNFWTITSFSNLYNEKVAKIITSPVFPIDQHTAYLRLDLNDPKDAVKKEFISLFIFLNNHVEKGIRVQFKFSVLASDKTEMLLFQKTDSLLKEFGKGTYYFMTKKVLMNELKDKLLPDDKLTIISKISILDQTANVQFDQSSKELESLFENKDFTDVTLCVDGKEIQAHKAILASKSLIFYVIFRIREKTDNLLQLTDISYDVATELLRFIYTGFVNNLKDLAKDLYIAADKYCIKDLKDICENHFVCSLNLESAAEMLIFAELHHVYDLKTCIEDLISGNIKEFIKTPGFLGQKKYHSPAMLEVLCKAIEKLN